MRNLWIFICMIFLCTKAHSGPIFSMYLDFIERESINYGLISVINNYVPHEFKDEFIVSTVGFLGDYKFPLYCLAIAKHESGNFRYMSSIKVNRNGSIDRGPMGLNSYNILNKEFNNSFRPNYAIYNENVLYMVMGINYFKNLYLHLGEVDSLYVYNAGYTRYLRSTLPRSTIQYQKSVYHIFSLLYQEFYTFYTKYYISLFLKYRRINRGF